MHLSGTEQTPAAVTTERTAAATLTTMTPQFHKSVWTLEPVAGHQYPSIILSRIIFTFGTLYWYILNFHRLLEHIRPHFIDRQQLYGSILT